MTLLGVFPPSAMMQLMISTAPADWAATLKWIKMKSNLVAWGASNNMFMTPLVGVANWTMVFTARTNNGKKCRWEKSANSAYWVVHTKAVKIIYSGKLKVLQYLPECLVATCLSRDRSSSILREYPLLLVVVWYLVRWQVVYWFIPCVVCMPSHTKSSNSVTYALRVGTEPWCCGSNQKKKKKMLYERWSCSWS